MVMQTVTDGQRHTLVNKWGKVFKRLGAVKQENKNKKVERDIQEGKELVERLGKKKKTIRFRNRKRTIAIEPEETPRFPLVFPLQNMSPGNREHLRA